MNAVKNIRMLQRSNSNRKGGSTPRIRRQASVGKMYRSPRQSAPSRVEGPVSTITTAPVAIGNSITGSQTRVVSHSSGVTCAGRDFMFTPVGSGSIATWVLCGGTPLSPAVFSDSTLRQYMQLYQKFKWKDIVVHYITSSPTSASGDVMFYYGKNRDSVFLSQTSPQLLPFVMSDPNTVLGPQWTNHSARLSVTADWKSTDYGMNNDINDYAAGEVFLLSKSASTDSPGYVIFDYVVEFADMQISPRLLTLPLPRGQYSQLGIGLTATAVVAGNAFVGVAQSNNISGTASSLPTGATVLDVYKVILDINNSASGAWTNGAPSTLVKLGTGGNATQAVTLVDGMTIYCVLVTATTLQFYPSATDAFALSNPMVFGVTAAVTFTMQSWLSLVGTINTTNIIPSY